MNLPTPVRELRPGLWVKDEGRVHDRYGGNKVRKLAHLLADAEARGATDLVTAGALGSHHVLATALLGAEHGLRTHAVLVPQPDTEHVRHQLARILAACASVTRVGGSLGAAVALRTVRARLAASGRIPYAIPVGGSSPVGVEGWIDGALELCGQIARGELPRPERIVVALGSGGTSAGLIAGLALGGMPVPVLAVRVAPRWLAHRGRVLALAGAALRRRGARVVPGPLVVDPGWLGA
ncbi:MAG: pyridoxal-phosphate dependent enzyme, partial [Alphaproteobacteria bacterium]|nr:pyridoxal-phosphate dependent enzyme [Alphaproteobacteria bacterium]